MKAALFFAFVALTGVVLADVSKKYECKDELVKAILGGIRDCQITMEFIMQFVGSPLQGQSAEVAISSAGQSNLRVKRDFGDTWNTDFGQFNGAAPSKKLTQDELLALLEEKGACLEGCLLDNPFYQEIEIICKAELAGDQGDSKTRLTCFFDKACERCPELLIIITMDIAKIKSAY